MGDNQVILDAYNIINLLLCSKQSIENTLDTYYKEMIPRSTVSVKQSRENTLFYHSPDAINKNILYKFKN